MKFEIEILSYSQSRFEAEEIANDGFVKIFKRIKSYDDKYPFEGWLRKIMIHSAIDFYRSQKKHYHMMDVEEAYDTENQEVDVLDQMAAEDIMRCVQDLSPAYRMVFTLYVIEGYNHREIGEQLNISEGTSKSNLAKAKAKLKELILGKDKTTRG